MVALWWGASHAGLSASNGSYADVRPVAFANFFVALRLVARCAARPSAPWSHSERSQCPVSRSVTPESASSFKDGSHGPLSAIRPTSPAAGATRPSAPSSLSDRSYSGASFWVASLSVVFQSASSVSGPSLSDAAPSVSSLCERSLRERRGVPVRLVAVRSRSGKKLSPDSNPRPSSHQALCLDH